jgi:copper chaperone CopZ
MTPILRRILALVIAVTVVAAGVVLIVEVVAAWFDAGPVLLSDTATATWRTTAWDDPAVVWTAIGIGVVGVLCLVAALWPDTPTTVPSRLDQVELERRPLEHTLQRQLQAVDGVADAAVSVRRSRATARVDTNRMLDTQAVETASRERLTDATRRLYVTAEPEVTVRAKRAQS